MDVERLVGDELTRRPLSGTDDVYLLLREAVLGREVERFGVAAELARAEPEGEGPIVEDLDEAQGTVRLNLRPFRFVRGTMTELWPLVERSHAAIRPDARRLTRCLRSAQDALRSAGRDPATLGELAARLESQGYPLVPHTKGYVQAYRPSYVVVLRSVLPSWVTSPPPDAG